MTIGSDFLSKNEWSLLFTLRRQYFALYPPYLLSLPPASTLASDIAQRYLLNDLLLLDDDDIVADCNTEIEGLPEEKSMRIEPSMKGKGKARLKEPEAGYKKQVLRKLVDRLERGVSRKIEDGDEEAEVDERFYEILAGLMVSSHPTSTLPEAGPSTAPKTSYRTFIYDSPVSMESVSRRRQEKSDTPQTSVQLEERRITLLEEQIAIQGGTTGLRTWTAALHLAHHILHHSNLLLPPSDVTRGVVELGAGTGFVSLLLGQLGVNVIGTDLGDDEEGHEEDEQGAGFRTPLGRLRSNIALNECAITPSVRALDWTDAKRPRADRPGTWTQLESERRTIVAADVIYDPDLVPPLVDAIDVLLHKGDEGQCAIISATVRNQETFDKFLNTCKQHGLITEDIDVPPMDSSSPTFWDSALDAGTQVRLIRITR
nr:uncharacterized protein CI109_001089 [Kwoniella shandongensis]KAA5530289.1 hypothetical protein CI109_001089 [Kwoniella shandongensis]